MKTSKISTILIILILNCAFAYSNTIEQIESDLQHDEWIGGATFIKKIKSINKEECSTLNKLYNEFNYPLVIIRILDSYTHTQCKNRLKLVTKLLSDKNPLIRAASVRLAADLSSNEKDKIRKLITKMLHDDQDKLVIKEAKKFLTSN